MSKRGTLFTLAASGVAAVALWVYRARRNPAAYAPSQSIFLELPRPFLSRERLLAVLATRPGEHLLEVGPGAGYYTADVARRLEPGGKLEILDVQQEMLDATMRRVGDQGILSVTPSKGDAQALPYPDATFDGAYLVATLGEVPDKGAALRELRRVLKPGGRLVAGEGQPDPHMVSFSALQTKAEAAGLMFEERVGGKLGYVARFRAK